MPLAYYEWREQQTAEILAEVAKHPSSHHDRPSGFTGTKCAGCGKLASYTGIADREGFIEAHVTGFMGELDFKLSVCSFKCAARALRRLQGLSTTPHDTA